MATEPSRDVEDRFAFGENWRSFVGLIDGSRLEAATQSLREMLGTDDLSSTSFLDVGCGSGLFSLAARRLGARVVSFDFDPMSVAATEELRARYATADSAWTVGEGSALDGAFMSSLGEFDVVYAWGVLHHTGRMWDAMANVAPLVAPGGRLFLSIYNDQGDMSHRWLRVKQMYNRRGPLVKKALLVGADLYLSMPRRPRPLLHRLLRGRPADERARGMDRQHDLVDWVGGLPFEVAPPDAVFEFYRSRGFVLERLVTCGGGIGCNQFVLARPARA